MLRPAATRPFSIAILDDRVTFINESGVVSTKKDLVAGAGPLPKGIHFNLTQTDWALQLYGNVAVTSFTDVQSGQAHGQDLHAKFRSTEVWLKEGAAWRMISSQTIALQDDPPSVALPAKVAGRICRRLSRRSRFYLYDHAQRRGAQRFSLAAARPPFSKRNCAMSFSLPVSRGCARFSSAMRTARSPASSAATKATTWFSNGSAEAVRR